MPFLWYIFFALVGLVAGSFLNVLAERLPYNSSLLRPQSNSNNSQRLVVLQDLIPIYGPLRRRGTRSSSYAGILQRPVWVQVGTGIVLIFLFWRYGLTVQFGVLALYGCVFILLLVIDLEHQLILNRVVYPAMVAALIINLFLPEPAIRRALFALVGGVAGFGLFLLVVLVSRGGMGWGDVKMAGLVGLVTGVPRVFVAIVVAVLLGGIVAIVLLAARKSTRKQAIPFGPFLAVGAMATLLYGEEILNWYLRANA